MFDINCLSMSGRLTRDCEFAYFGNKIPALKFTLANNRGFKKDDKFTNHSHFFDCVLFGKRSESLIQLLTKGTQVVITGSLRHESWSCKRTGENKTRYSVLVNEIQVLTSHNNVQKTSYINSKEEFDEDIPF
ncbi:single-stranded DNA-binding protein (plasmid) [Borrelia coriaceae]|uniref:Single-stranded DNA-binding protein n=1 Tax=Borrelia coriaceae ATCC 43381 TaxID=1408429 RepID=W5SY29_9SPIR|nr:single-stranded DNA-binding protein [Borrelia coriaceae]AHH11777.1 Single-strand DNA binding protein [Borrelia coriaceae ATCC 43381]UPA16818.1 single-stranded DNA-binding protein [Borrelia coriaceae]